MVTPRISICIVAHNGAKFVRRCLNSILRQNVMPYEIVFVDDGSIDETAKIVEEYAQLSAFIHFFKLPKNSGVGIARNYALEQATGDYVWAVDVDDTIASNSLELFSRAVESWGSDVIVAGANCLDAKGKIHSISKVDREYVNICPLEWPNLAVFSTGLHWTMLIKKRLLSENKIKYGERLKCSADGFFLFCLIWKVRTMSLIPDIVYNYSDVEMSTSKKRDVQYYHDDFLVYSVLVSNCKDEKDFVYAAHRIMYRIDEFFDVDLRMYWANFNNAEKQRILVFFAKIFSGNCVCDYIIRQLLDKPSESAFSFSRIPFLAALKNNDCTLALELVDIQSNSFSFCLNKPAISNIIFVLERMTPFICSVVRRLCSFFKVHSRFR